MRTTNAVIESDLTGATSSAFFVVQVVLDSGTYYFGDRSLTLGSDIILPALLDLSAINPDSVSFSLDDSQVNPAITFWINRPVKIYQLTENSSDASDGYLVFDGIILNQPSLQEGNLGFSAGPSRLNPAVLPPGDPINTQEHPNAGKAALNKLKPVIYGQIDKASLLPIDVPAVTTLAKRAVPGDQSLRVSNTEDFASSGSVVIENQTYSYTSKDDSNFYGLTIVDEHQSGTQVAEAQQAVYLAAGHAVTDINNIRASDGDTQESQIFNGTVDLGEATVTFSSPPTLEEEAGEANIEIQFDEVDVSSTAINTINAIQAATGVEIQSATSLPVDITDQAPGEIEFAVPVPQGGTNRIISAAYTVEFDVDILGGIPQLGKTIVTIGGKVAWVWDGGQVVYDASPITVINDRDVNQLPVRVELDGAQSLAFTVDITAASRTVVLGNLDQAAYATLRKPSNTEFIVNQTTDNPNRGRIERARLVVEHFSATQSLDQVDVIWDGSTIGQLSADNLASGGQSVHTIDIDTISSGTAELISTSIDNALTSAFSRVDNAISIPINVPIAYTVRRFFGNPTFTYVYALETTIALPENIVGGTYIFTISSNSAAGGVNNTSQAELEGVAFSPNGSSQNVSVTLADDQTSMTLVHDADLTIPTGEFPTNLFPTIRSITGTVQSRTTENAIDITGEQPTGSIAVMDGTSTVAGVESAANVDGTGTGALTVTIPTPPRTVINTFDLPGIENWPDLTNKQLEFEYAGSDTEDVNIVRAFVAVEFERVIKTPAKKIIASVTGKSGNAADVLKDLIELNGQTVNSSSYTSFQSWCITNSFNFGRIIDSQQEVSGLLNNAAIQANIQLAETESGLAMIRRLDDSTVVTDINDADLFEPATISWSSTDDIENDITVNYRKIDGEFTESLIINQDTPNAIAALSVTNLNDTRKIEFDAGWVAEATSAGIFADDYVKLMAPMRRFISFSLPYSFSRLEQGDLVRYVPADLTARIQSISNEDGWINLTAEEIYSE